MLKRIKKISAEEIRLLIFFIFSLVIIFFLTYNLFSFSAEFTSVWPADVLSRGGSRSYRLLDGKIAAAEKSHLRPIAVTIENHADSRPAAGLDGASIIYEVVVEGDITRFLALFDGDAKAKKIGPVRSARPFFVDLVKEWQAVYFHAGGSQAALNQLKLNQTADINEISADGIYFWRDPSREMPHNLFTSTDLMARAISAKEIDLAADFLPWLFKNEEPAPESELVSELEINFSNNPWYQVEYKYNPEDNEYTRYLAGKVHKTEKGIILEAKNIIVQHVDFTIIDSYGRMDVDLKTGGLTEIYQDGRMIEGNWKKTLGRTRFYDQNDNEIRFNRGTIWVELVF